VKEARLGSAPQELSQAAHQRHNGRGEGHHHHRDRRVLQEVPEAELVGRVLVGTHDDPAAALARGRDPHHHVAALGLGKERIDDLPLEQQFEDDESKGRGREDHRQPRCRPVAGGGSQVEAHGDRDEAQEGPRVAAEGLGLHGVAQLAPAPPQPLSQATLSLSAGLSRPDLLQHRLHQPDHLVPVPLRDHVAPDTRVRQWDPTGAQLGAKARSACSAGGDGQHRESLVWPGPIDTDLLQVVSLFACLFCVNERPESEAEPDLALFEIPLQAFNSNGAVGQTRLHQARLLG